MSEKNQGRMDQSVGAGFSRRRVLAAGVAAGLGTAAGAVPAAAASSGASGPAVPARSGQDERFPGPWQRGLLQPTENGRFLQHEDGTPFFWTADTAWLLHKLSREEVRQYFENRQEKQFNVVLLQVVPASLEYQDYYGNTPFLRDNVRRPNPAYWDHITHMVEEAARAGIYMAMNAVWRNIVKDGLMDARDAGWYGRWLARRYKDYPNIVWLIGGDSVGSQQMDVWLSLAEAIRREDPHHLMTFHPNGRFSSSTWFHNESWLDFNMFQSGHRNYEQTYEGVSPTYDSIDVPTYWKAEDTWMYVHEDYSRYPAKPTLDGEPSYEHVHQGLHDFSTPFWDDADTRRYAYWSVFGGSCGHTYGNGGVMPMHVPSDGPVNGYDVSEYWYETMDDPGAGQMQHVKNLMLSRPYFHRIPGPTLVDGDPGFRHDRVVATYAEEYAFAYIHTGRSFSVKLGEISGDRVVAWWYDPRNGTAARIGEFDNTGVRTFDPPDEPGDSNDWVLVLDDASQSFGEPGEPMYDS